MRAGAVRGGARWLGVTSVEEGVAARQLGRARPGHLSETRILVIAGVFPGQGAALIANRLTPVAGSRGTSELEAAAQAAPVTPGSLAVHLN